MRKTYTGNNMTTDIKSIITQMTLEPDYRTLTNFDVNYMDSLVRISISLPECVVIRR